MSHLFQSVRLLHRFCCSLRANLPSTSKAFDIQHFLSFKWWFHKFENYQGRSGAQTLQGRDQRRAVRSGLFFIILILSRGSFLSDDLLGESCHFSSRFLCDPSGREGGFSSPFVRAAAFWIHGEVGWLTAQSEATFQHRLEALGEGGKHSLTSRRPPSASPSQNAVVAPLAWQHRGWRVA